MQAAFCGAQLLAGGCIAGLAPRRLARAARLPSPSRHRQACHRHARRAGHAGRFYGAALRQSRRAEGRPAGRRRARHLRQPQSADRPGPRRAADPRLCHREPDGARLRRAVHALRPAGAHRRDRRRAKLRHLHARSGGAFFRRHAGHRRRRGVLLAAAARPRPAQSSHLLFQGRQGRNSRSAHRAVRFRRHQRPRIAADPRPDAGAAEARHRCRDVRELDVGEADRQRSLCRRRRRCRARASPSSAIPNYWGRDLPINRGLWNFDEVRFDFYRDANAYFEAFKAGLYDVRSETDPTRWQTGYDFPAVRDGRVVKETFSQRAAEIRFRFRLQHAPADFRRYPRAPGDRAVVRFPMDQPQFFLQSVSAQRELLRRLRTVRLSSPGRRNGARAACALSRRGAPRRARRHLVAAGHRRLGPRPRHAAPGARVCSKPPATSSKAPTLRDRATGRPLRLRNHGDEPRRRAAGARLCHHAGARRHRRAGAPRRRRAISSSACRRSIST